MNLNPLKKDDNTDALVQALEDANNAGGDAAVQPPVDQSAPTGVADGAVTPGMVADQPDTTSVDDTATTTDTATDASLPAPSTDTTSSVTFEGNDLPAGLSADADAHLPTEGVGDTGELDGVKKSALEQLRPLIEKLELEPADKFDKYLMMLRASDDPALIKPAFEAAQGISGEKEKAQALLDIINEINYITANQQQ